MQVAAARTGVRLCDGWTNVLPVGEPGAAGGLARCTRGSYVGRWTVASTRAGTSTRPSCRPATWRRTPSSATVCCPPPAGSRAYVDRRAGRLPRRARHRLRPGRLPAARRRAAALDPGEVDRPGRAARSRRRAAPTARRGPMTLTEAERAARGPARGLLAVCDSPGGSTPSPRRGPYGRRGRAPRRGRPGRRPRRGRPRRGPRRPPGSVSSRPGPGPGGRVAPGAGRGGPRRDTRAALAEGNRAYEERFGHVYLICATGRTAAEMLAVLRGPARATTRRPSARSSATSSAKITRLRLQRLLEG